MKLTPPVTLSEAAEILQCEYIGNPEHQITGINEIHRVENGDLTFVDVEKYYKKALTSAATTILINKQVAPPAGKGLLVSDDPFRDYNKLTTHFQPRTPLNQGINPSIKSAHSTNQNTPTSQPSLPLQTTAPTLNPPSQTLSSQPQKSATEQNPSTNPNPNPNPNPNTNTNTSTSTSTSTSTNPNTSTSTSTSTTPPQPAHSPNIHPTAQIGHNVTIGHATTIAENVEIGHNTVIGSNVTIGAGTLIYPNVTIYDNTTIGPNCVIQANVVIGSDAFYYKARPDRRDQMISVGETILEEAVHIGAGTTIDRGVSAVTRIGAHTKIDNQVQIGHDTIIGKHCVLAAQVGVAGCVEIGDRVNLWGQVGVVQNLTIGNNATLIGKTGVMSDLEGGKAYGGMVADDYSAFLRKEAILKRLIKAMPEIENLLKANKESEEQ